MTLADRIVAQGVGRYCADKTHLWAPCGNVVLTDDAFINDGRVVLALITILRKHGHSFLLHSMPDGKAVMTVQTPLPDRSAWTAQIADDNDAVAICEACLTALENSNDQ